MPSQSPSPSMSPLAWALLGALALLWGTSFLGNRLALQGVGPFTIVAFRTCGAGLLLWAIVLLRRLPVPWDWALLPRFVMIGVLNCALPFSLIAWGQQYIASSLAGILNAASAIFGVAVAALILRDEQLTPRKALGVLVGFCGVILAIGPEALHGLSLTSVGQFAIIGAALCYSFGAAHTRMLTRGLAPEVGAAGMMTGATLWQVPVALIFEGVPGFDWPAPVDFALLWLIVGCTTMAYLVYFRVLALAGAGNASLVTLLIPPVAIIAGVVAFGERLTLSEVFGFAVIAAGLLILNSRPKPRDAARPAR
ncbi:DMT family transporter [Paenirhodobacter sp.]|uniref:DMT family transporter n=1 Tax=Paenirhodobacter sp. TaxID=1965326 RepID=UPI003B409560